MAFTVITSSASGCLRELNEASGLRQPRDVLQHLVDMIGNTCSWNMNDDSPAIPRSEGCLRLKETLQGIIVHRLSELLEVKQLEIAQPMLRA
jgi:hypothetical protein